jgi:hypothetical protein
VSNSGFPFPWPPSIDGGFVPPSSVELAGFVLGNGPLNLYSSSKLPDGSPFALIDRTGVGVYHVTVLLAPVIAYLTLGQNLGDPLCVVEIVATSASEFDVKLFTLAGAPIDSVFGVGFFNILGITDALDLEVRNLNDAGPGSLRDAVANAGLVDGSVVTFMAGLTGTIALTSGQLKAAKGVTIQGPGSGVITIDGTGNADRFLYLYATGPAGPVTLSGLTIKNFGPPAAGTHGGAIVNYNMKLHGSDLVLQGNSGGKGGAVASFGETELTDSQVTGNHSTHAGGGVYLYGGPTRSPANALTRVAATGNTSVGLTASSTGGGGVAANMQYGSLDVDECTISGNSAGGPGGGLATYAGRTAAVAVRRSTIAGNTTTQAHPGAVQSGGGGAMLDARQTATILLENSTVDGNHSLGNAGAGGVKVGTDVGAAVTMHFDTITSNDANALGAAGGGLKIDAASVLALRNTIVGLNAATSAADISGALDADYSAIENTTGAVITGANNVTGVNPQLGALASNGGPTQTRLPNTGSPVVDAGDPAFVPPPTTDQRGTGFPRVKGGRVDIGSVER